MGIGLWRVFWRDVGKVTRVVIAQRIVGGKQCRHAVEEVVVIFVSGVGPKHLGKRSHARHSHILHLRECGNVFGPEISLSAKHERRFGSIELLRHRFEAVDALHRDESANGERLELSLLALIEIEIEMRVRRENHAVAASGAVDGTGIATPRGDDGVAWHVALKHFVPTNHCSASLLDYVVGKASDIALQAVVSREFAFCRDAFPCDASLTARTFFPAYFRALVAADVDVLRREQVDDFVQHIADELHSAVVAHAKHLVAYAPLRPHVVRTARAAQMRIGSQCGAHVSRHINFGNHLDVALGSVANHVAHLLLGVESAVRHAVPFARIATDDGLCAHRTHLGEARIFLDFDAPTLVVGQVPVEGVHIVQCQHIDELLHLIDTVEMAADVEHHAAIGKSGSVGDGGSRHRHLLRRALRQRFAQHINTTEGSGSRCAVNHNAVGTHREPICFAVGVAERGVQHNGSAFAVKFYGDARRLLDVLRKQLRFGLQSGVAADAYALLQHKGFALIADYRIWQRNHLI